MFHRTVSSFILTSFMAVPLAVGQAATPPATRAAQPPTAVAPPPSLASSARLYQANAGGEIHLAVGTVVHALVRNGDIEAAKQLLPLTSTEASKYAGLLAAYTPGAGNVAGAKRLLGGKPAMGNDLRLGLVAGFAAQGKVKEAAAISATITDELHRSITESIILRRQATPANVQAFTKKYRPSSLWPDAFVRLAQSSVRAGDKTLSKQLLDSAVERSPRMNDFPDEVRGAIADSLHDAGDHTLAKEIAATIKGTGLAKTVTQWGEARLAARKGDLAALQRLAAAPENADVRSDIAALQVYAEALSGHSAAAEKVCVDAFNSRRGDDVRFAVLFGMLSAAHRDAGRTKEAERTLQMANDLIAKLPQAHQRGWAGASLIRSAAFGVDYYGRNRAFSDLW